MRLIREKLELDEILNIALNWGNDISKKPELSLATQFIFDKLFSQSALRVHNIKNNFYSDQQFYFSISKLVDILAETFTSNELANMHMDWQKNFSLIKPTILIWEFLCNKHFTKYIAKCTLDRLCNIAIA